MKKKTAAKPKPIAPKKVGRPTKDTQQKLLMLSPANLEWLAAQAAARKAAGEVGVSQSSIVDDLITAARA